jgi:orotate phosphoribosyltransferase
MQTHQKEFIEFAISCEVLRFGDFTLKSGRRSPYFFNTGRFDTGARIGHLGEFYATAIRASGIDMDMLYGPAYKGIPLVTATAIALARLTSAEIPFAFNRKEAKDHGEGGIVIGAPLEGKVLIVDDVITAGTSVRESVDLIRSGGAEPCGVLIALDREEVGQTAKSAVQEVRERLGIPVHPIITLRDLLEYLEETGNAAARAALEQHRSRYGAPAAG